MLLAMAAAVAAVAGGAALALAGVGPRVLGPLRAFALAAVIATVLGHLLPEAVEDGGALVLLAFGAALAAPGVIARLAAGSEHHHEHRLATELAYASLLLHKVTDGVALGAATAPGAPAHWDVIAAIAAHSVPMAAVVALAYRDRPRVAWLRATGLAAAIVAGAALADAAAVTVLGGASPWLGAIASGLLLHVVTHDLPAPSARRGDRALELVALAAGAALPLAFASESHGMGAAVLASARAVAPPIALGLAVSVMMQALGGATALRPPRGVARAIAVAAALPGCACAATPTAIELRGLGATLGAAAALAVAAPALGADALFVSIALFGAPLAAVRLGASVALAATIGAIAGRGAPHDEHEHEHDHEPPLLHGSFVHRASTALDELVTHLAPWLALGVAAAALLGAAHASLAGLHPLATAAIAATLVVPARISLAAAVAPAAALVAAGLPAGAAIAAITVAPALHGALAMIRREAGAPRALASLAAALAIAAIVVWLAPAPRAPLFDTPRAVQDAALALLALLALRSLWRFGAAAWIAALHGHGQHGAAHDEVHRADPAPPHADHHGAHHAH